MRGQHAIDIGELEENRRRLRDLAAKINHLEEANSELDERAKGLSKDMDTRSEQEKLEVKPSFEHIFFTILPRSLKRRSISRVCWRTMRSRWRITKR